MRYHGLQKTVHCRLGWHLHIKRSQLDKGNHVETRLFSLHFAMKLWKIPVMGSKVMRDHVTNKTAHCRLDCYGTRPEIFLMATRPENNTWNNHDSYSLHLG
jgi:hypothetical protein